MAVGDPDGSTSGSPIGDVRYKLPLNLLYVSTSLLWWQAVVGIIRVKLSAALRSNLRCTWRHREGSRNVHNTAIRRALSPSRPCGRVTAGVHGCPRGVAPIRHHIAIRDNSVVAHVRRNDPSASQFLVMRCLPASPLFASCPWPRHNWMLVGSS